MTDTELMTDSAALLSSNGATTTSGTVRQGFDSVPEAIRRALESRIADMNLQPGHRLGLKSALQHEFGVAGPTIDQALQLLVNDGLISIRRGPGGGVFVARSHPVLRQGSKQLWARDIESLVENIELRETLTGLLGVSAARAKSRDPEKLRELVDLADAVSSREEHSFENQRLIWRGHHLLAELADNASLRFIYTNLLQAAEALIIQIEFPNAGPGADRERLRRDAHAGLFRAVVAGDIHAAWTFGETVRIVSPHGRDKHLVSVDGTGPSRLVSAESPSTAVW
ncbi:MAG: FadR/GntR family transcriptional regulator [Candidatus Limnocylindrales bacterium]